MGKLDRRKIYVKVSYTIDPSDNFRDISQIDQNLRNEQKTKDERAEGIRPLINWHARVKGSKAIPVSSQGSIPYS